MIISVTAASLWRAKTRTSLRVEGDAVEIIAHLNGHRMLTIHLEDRTTQAEIIIPPKATKKLFEALKKAEEDPDARPC